VPRITLHVWVVLTVSLFIAWRPALGTIAGFIRDEAFIGNEASMSDRVPPAALDASQLAAQELQNRFITDNLRRVFCSFTGLSENVDDGTCPAGCSILPGESFLRLNGSPGPFLLRTHISGLQPSVEVYIDKKRRTRPTRLRVASRSFILALSG